MKIAMVTADIRTEPGRGIAVYTEELSDGLKKNGLNIHQLFYKMGSATSFLRLLPQLRKYDIVHIQFEFGLFGRFAGVKIIPLLLIMRSLGVKKVVITVHTIHDKKEKLIHKSRLWIELRKTIIYPFQNVIMGLFSDALIFHAQFLAERMRRVYHINRKKLFVIPQGVRDNQSIIDKQTAKRKLGIKGPLYLMIGNVGYQKGYDIIIKHAKEIGKNIILFGSTVEKGITHLDYLKKYVKDNHLEKIVTIDTEMDPLGTGNKKWWLYFSAADLILLPYRSMTTSAVFINAMQAHKPVVGSNTLYFNEIARKYGCIKIAKTEDDYPRVIKEAMKKLKKIEEEAKRFHEDNSFKVISQEYKRVYDGLIK